MRQNPHVRICGGPGSATTLVYPTKVEAGRLWLEGFERGTRRVYGPILVPAAATKLLCKGWDLSCALGRVDGTWRIVEVANVYPV